MKNITKSKGEKMFFPLLQEFLLIFRNKKIIVTAEKNLLDNKGL